jgi:cell division protein FtsQ
MKKRTKLLLLIFGIAALLVFANRMINSYDESVCTDFRVNIINSSEESFVSPEELKQEVKTQYHEPQGIQMSEIDLEKIAQIISTNPYVRKVKTYKSLDAVIIADVEQREPLVRAFNMQGKSFIIDMKGDIMPIPQLGKLNLLCAGGYIDIEPDSFTGVNVQTPGFDDMNVFKALNSVYLTALALKNDIHFSEMISQIYVNNEYEIELIPVVGDFILFFGTPDKAKEKIDKMHILYTRLVPFIDMKAYGRVDLTIDNQLVLQKKQTNI